MHYNLKKIRLLKFKRPIVLTGGAFDVLHFGHIAFLQKCKSFSETLIVQVSSDRDVRQRKGPSRPIINEAGREGLLCNLKCVDFAFTSDEHCESKPIYDAIKPDILVLSDEHKEEKLKFLKESLGAVVLKKLKVIFVPNKFYSSELSTGKIIDKINSVRS